jgi:hypothetical protein
MTRDEILKELEEEFEKLLDSYAKEHKMPPRVKAICRPYFEVFWLEGIIAILELKEKLKQSKKTLLH